MNRTAMITTVAAGALAASLVATPAGAAPARPTKTLDAQDAKFLKVNYQTDLAEITLGHLVQKKLASGSYAVQLSEQTVRDHQRIATVVRGIAKTYGITLPSAPNAVQQAAAANVNAAHHTSYRYFLAELAGHTTSIAQTHNELKKGQSKTVLAFATRYLPIAEDHYSMAKADLPHAPH